MRIISSTITRIADDIANPHENEWVSKKDYPRPPREWGSDFHETDLGWGRGVKQDEQSSPMQSTRNRFIQGDHRAPAEYMDFLLNEPLGSGQTSYNSLVQKYKDLYEKHTEWMDIRQENKKVHRGIHALLGEIEMQITSESDIVGKRLKDLVKDCNDETVITSVRDLDGKKQEYIQKIDNAMVEWTKITDEIGKTADLKNGKEAMAKNLFHRSLMIKQMATPEEGLSYPIGHKGKELKERVLGGVTWISSIIDWKKLNSPVQIATTEDGLTRPRYNPKTATIKLTQLSDDGSYLHELGHHLEHSHISVGDMARKFYEKRTAGKKLVKMKELDPYGKYDDQEYGRDDTFISKYTGKIYEDGYTEIISMGLEHLYRDPVEFRLKDPEHFELIIKALRLLRHESQ